jgi:uncharacterized radical SAM superfamily Fe-S cluster-containing enzyme
MDNIREHYGTGIDVQVTGGNPKLRPRDELIAIVRRLREQGQRPTLMTNGIKADRGLLRNPATYGLKRARGRVRGPLLQQRTPGP